MKLWYNLEAAVDQKIMGWFFSELQISCEKYSGGNK